MPLHLLGKKSWNVYNADNIARVRRDEAAAQAREEAEEQQQQDQDAERRLAILRGEVPPPLPAPRTDNEEAEQPPRAADRTFREPSRKRKRAGENDTDFEMRVARECGMGSRTVDDKSERDSKRLASSDAPIIDHRGHIDLFPEERKDERSAQRNAKNEDAEREKARKQREYEDQYTMRFSNAAGRDGTLGTGRSGPWYAKSGSGDLDTAEDSLVRMPQKDVWGNEDPRRGEREERRIVSSDPLAVMKRGAAKVREVERERKTANAERDRDIRQLKKEERRKEKRRKRRDREYDAERSGGFSLDGQVSSRGDSKDPAGENQRRSADGHARERRHGSEEDRRCRDKPEEHRGRHQSSRQRGSRDHDGRDGRSDRHDRRRATKTDHY
ncbi:hypothetical protein F4778DRAFT_718821 [Xylariomycetidae sp. FL2044]|nr:hypothetical protein F4778DRAFT_718821 [Xylariomycetidae sp. FL2044]